jgi:serine/threonine protein phosphatase PrpC
VTVHERTDDDRFLVVACDGVWNAMKTTWNAKISALLRDHFDDDASSSSSSSISISGRSGDAGASGRGALLPVAERVIRGGNTRDQQRLLAASRDILSICLQGGSDDNITALVVGLGPATAAAAAAAAEEEEEEATTANVKKNLESALGVVASPQNAHCAGLP